MNRQLKCAILYLSRSLGLFWLSRRFTKQGLRILCYHGFSIDDEHIFRPKLFIQMKSFKERLNYLARKKYPVLTLNSALEALANSRLPPNATVITIDDGFYGVYSLARNELTAYGFPATIYVTSYYAQKQTPIFRLVVQYMFFASEVDRLLSAPVEWNIDDSVELNDVARRDETMWKIIQYGETECDETARQDICEHLGKILNVEYARIVNTHLFSIMSGGDLSDLERDGFDIQLHTHRHRLAVENKADFRREIIENRNYLRTVVDTPLEHFCYPSGIWSEMQWAWLEELGIVSATTCESGFNYRSSPRLGLRRYLDDDSLSQIEFEAEMSGFLEVARQVRKLVRSEERV